MNSPTLLLRTIVLATLATAPLAAVAQVSTAAANFATEMGTENIITTNNLTLNSDVDSGVASGGTVSIGSNTSIDSMGAYKDDAYSFKDYGQLSLTGSNGKVLGGGGEVVKNTGTNSGLNDFSVNNGGMQVLTFGSSSSSTPNLTFNGNGGKPTVSFLSSPDTYFSSRLTALTNDSSIFKNASATNLTASSNTLTVNGTPRAVTVFNLDVGTAGSFNQISLNVAAGSEAIVNVFGAGTTWSPGSVNFIGSSQNSASQVIWNFEGGLNFTTSAQWDGSLLDVGGTVTDGGNDIYGQIFAGSFVDNTNNEIHDKFFVPVPIPEPVDYAALAGMAVLVAAAIRRQGVLKAG
jgi:choice-of-anchor A domain-containing protein